MAHLPLDLLFQEVLPWLPVKSLLRFRCVSKLWYSLLKTPEFARTHLRRLTKNNQKLLLKSYLDNYPSYQEYFFTFDYGIDAIIRHDFPLEDVKYKLLLCSCDGMVCMAILPLKRHSGFLVDLVLWNPSTGDFRKLQSTPRRGINPGQEGWAFYYDEIVKDYKILNVNEHGKAYTYSLKSNSWRMVGSVDEISCYSSDQGVFISGCIYWTAKVHDYTHVILSFDLSNQKFTKLPLLRSPSSNLKLIIHQECLLLFISHDFGKEIELWRMNGNKEADWERTTSLISRLEIWEYVWSAPICFMSSGKLFMSLRKNFRDDIQFVTYDPGDHTIKQNFQMNIIGRILTTLTYIQTLVSPNDVGW